MTFIIEPQSQGCLFTGQIFLRGIGPIGKYLHQKEFTAVRQHMKEESQNLKQLVELNDFVQNEDSSKVL